MIRNEIRKHSASSHSKVVVDAGTVQIFGNDTTCAVEITNHISAVVNEFRRATRAARSLNAAAESVVGIGDCYSA